MWMTAACGRTSGIVGHSFRVMVIGFCIRHLNDKAHGSARLSSPKSAVGLNFEFNPRPMIRSS